MNGQIPLLVSALLLIGTGSLHGLITNRWSASTGLQEAISRLDHLPASVGDWEGTVLEQDFNPTTVRKSGAFVLARYVNRRTGEALQVSLICGRPGTLSLHPPTICFPAHGYQEKARPTKVAISLDESAPPTNWMTADFARPLAGGEERVSVLWCYGVNRMWLTPENPRIELAGREAVYKLYVGRVGLGEELRSQKDPSVAFLRVFFPALEKSLFAP